MGSFLSTSAPLQVIAICSHGDALVFDVQPGGKLLRSLKGEFLELPFQLVRIVGLVEHALDSEWYLDPDPLLISLGSWRLWL